MRCCPLAVTTWISTTTYVTFDPSFYADTPNQAALPAGAIYTWGDETRPADQLPTSNRLSEEVRTGRTFRVGSTCYGRCGCYAFSILYKRDLGDEWPFTADYVNLICIPRSDQTRLITATLDETTYRLNDLPAANALPREELEKQVVSGHPEGTVDWLAKEAWNTCK